MLLLNTQLLDIVLYSQVAWWQKFCSQLLLSEVQLYEWEVACFVSITMCDLYFFRKKRIEEEEAEVKRKATDAAYQG